MSGSGDLSRWATWRELHSQPKIWRDWAEAFDPAPFRAWVADSGAEEIWFTGAGTSAYIGDIIVAGLERQRGPRLRSVPTTDLVSRPHVYLTGRRPLVVSFGRSGNSSETVGTLDALSALVPDAPQLNITCNSEGALALRGGVETRAIILPDATHDAGFAMTSSFSTMLLTALAVLDRDGELARLSTLADQLDGVLPKYEAHVGDMADRLVFLGTGPMAFAAREAALKVMELTAGRIPCLWDSTLGFRHGPKSFVQPGTRIILFTCDEAPARAYENDLATELRAQFPESSLTTVGPGGDIDLAHSFGPVWATPLAIAFAQVMGCVWSDACGLDVDDPFRGAGTLSRVVSGVTLYPVTA
jgi:tagatose-6-phosphate ketose/aldose isomerase